MEMRVAALGKEDNQEDNEVGVMEKNFNLHEIVEKLNGGSILPVGETNCDNRAFERMKELESVALELILDIERVAELESNEYSVSRASTDARAWLREVRESIDDVLQIIDKYKAESEVKE